MGPAVSADCVFRWMLARRLLHGQFGLHQAGIPQSSTRCLLPMAAAAIRLRRWPLSMTSRLSNQTTTSPRFNPARSAEPFGLQIGNDRALHVRQVKNLRQQGRFILGRCAKNPSAPHGPSWMRLCMAVRHVVGNIKPRSPTLPPVGLAMAVLIPTSSPIGMDLLCQFAELPGLIGASV